MDASASKKVMAHRVLSGVLAVAAVAGWSLYGYSASSSGAIERELRTQVTEVWNDRTRIIEERDRLRTRVGELQQAQVELVAARKQLSELDAVGAPQSGDPIQPRLEQSALPEEPESDAPASTGAILSPSEVLASIKTAQLVLTELGFGPLQSDGVMGQKTRRAIESFERAKGLTVTGELGPRTVQALKSAAENLDQPPVARAAASADLRE